MEAPAGTPLAEIKAAVQRHACWMLKHLGEIEVRKPAVSGAAIRAQGHSRFKPARLDLYIRGQLRVQGAGLNAPRIERAVNRWYCTHSAEVFERRLAQAAQELPWINATPPWRLREMQVQWGSCSPEGVIILNPHLVKAPARAVEYVILHELCHLAEHNHSPRFYRLLDDHMSDWRTVKQRLDEQVEVLLV